MTARLVVLASGSGTLLQALIDECGDGALDAVVVGVVCDVPGAMALRRAEAAAIPTVTLPPANHDTRNEWDVAVLKAVQSFAPDLIVSAGFMRLLGPVVVDAFEGLMVNTHPALLPAFPGAHAVRDALAYGVKVTGCTVHVIDHGVDSGPILAQRAVDVLPGDDEETLHERIKAVERELLVQTVAALIEGGARG